MRIVQVPRTSLYAKLYGWYSDWRSPIFYIHQLVFAKRSGWAGSKHYDVGKELYTQMLDSSKQYSCAFYSLSQNDNLDAAQSAKLAITIDRLHLTRPGLKILDIGCGWGALAMALVQRPGNHHVIGITLSEDQFSGASSARELLNAEVRQRLEFRLEDYSSYLTARCREFDRIVSIGMFEHVGFWRHAHFYRSVERSLSVEGRALIHSIIRPYPGAYNEWMQRNIFPGSFLPSLAEMISGAERAGLIVDAVHVHPPSDYEKTLREWRRRLEASWPALARQFPQRFNDRAKRTWLFYLASMEATFAEDTSNFRIAQIELRKAPGSVNVKA